MVPVKHLDIAVIGDQELVNALRLAGASRYLRIEGDHDLPEKVRKNLTDLLAQPDIGIIVILEDYAQHALDLLAQVRKKKGTTPVIVQVPSKFGTRQPDTKAFYRALVRESIGFKIEI